MVDWAVPNSPGVVLRNIHTETARCRVGGCMIHNPTQTSIMNIEKWPYLWRYDTGVMERICRHGRGHPDYDVSRYLKSQNQEWAISHACDGCCREVVING